MTIDCLEAIRQAILDYRIFGSEGLNDALKKSLSEIVLYHEELKSEERKNEGRIISKFGQIIIELHSILVVASKIKKLSAPVTQLMLGSGDES